jgi:monofunctional biosynthetic peptidoglycan transglycosylase
MEPMAAPQVCHFLNVAAVIAKDFARGVGEVDQPAHSGAPVEPIDAPTDRAGNATQPAPPEGLAAAVRAPVLLALPAPSPLLLLPAPAKVAIRDTDKSESEEDRGDEMPRVPEGRAAVDEGLMAQPMLEPTRLEAPQVPDAVASEVAPAPPGLPPEPLCHEAAGTAPVPGAIPGAAEPVRDVVRHRAMEPALAPASAAPARDEALAAVVPWVQSTGAASAALPSSPLPAWPSRDAARGLLPYVRLALRGAAAAVGGLAITVVLLVVLYRWVNPPVSMLMLGQSITGTPIERTWVPIDRVSPNLIRAVVLSEDGRFCGHHGVDLGALKEAMESDRGGSTITMQVVKNLFLWPSRSYVRKAIEISLAYLVEAIWPKRRILEIYLNIAEWGDGIFGAEAAARAHFDKRASRLTVEEAALLAVALPNPIERTAGAPSLGTGRLASRLLDRMAASRADLSCLPAPRTAPRKAPLVSGR